jgi:hypothetical protein
MAVGISFSHAARIFRVGTGQDSLDRFPVFGDRQALPTGDLRQIHFNGEASA